MKDTCRNQLFLYTNDKQSKNEIKKAISFTVVSKIIKYLGINFNQEGERFVHSKPQNIVERN